MVKWNNGVKGRAADAINITRSCKRCFCVWCSIRFCAGIKRQDGKVMALQHPLAGIPGCLAKCKLTPATLGLLNIFF